MGVDLGDLVPKKNVRLTDLRGRIVAIDAFNTLYQFLSIIRQPDGTPLMDAKGRPTSHLAGLLYRTANLLEAGIKPVFVFDGAPHELKKATLAERSARKVEAELQLKEAQAAGDVERARTKATQTARLDSAMVAQAKDLLDRLGLPWVQAPSEGEAQASVMARTGRAWAAVSQDFDSLLFGAPRLVRNLAVSGRRKLPGKRVWVDVEPEVIDLEESLKALGLTREQLVDVGILVGTDFHPGVKGVGPKRAVKLLKEHGDLAAVLRHVKAEIPQADEIRRIFLSPAVAEDVAPAWRAPDRDAVVAMLVAEHGFTKERVTTALDRYGALAEAQKQRSLDTFF